MIVLWIIIGVIVAAFVLGVVLRANFGNGAAVDRVRRIDPEAAARIEQRRAEQGLRGLGQGGFGGGGSF